MGWIKYVQPPSTNINPPHIHCTKVSKNFHIYKRASSFFTSHIKIICQIWLMPPFTSIHTKCLKPIRSKIIPLTSFSEIPLYLQNSLTTSVHLFIVYPFSLYSIFNYTITEFNQSTMPYTVLHDHTMFNRKGFHQVFLFLHIIYLYLIISCFTLFKTICNIWTTLQCKVRCSDLGPTGFSLCSGENKSVQSLQS